MCDIITSNEMFRYERPQVKKQSEVREPSRVTLQQVAAHAGVSPATVSKVLNMHGDVSAATRARVREVVEELGYRPRTSHRPATSPVIEVKMDRFYPVHEAAILDSIVRTAEELDVDLQVSRIASQDATGRPLSARAWVKRLRRSGSAGLIVLAAELDSSQLAALARERIPVVAIDPMEGTFADAPSVTGTNWAGGYAAAEHLISLGHREIGVIGGRPESVAAVTRVHGARAACQAAGLALDEARVELAGFGHDAGVVTAQRWFSDGIGVTGIVTGNDTQAMGVIEVARQHGLRVPEDLSVVGYDDTYLASWSTPPLTTIRQPLAEIGRVALKNVLALVEGRAPDASHVELATELVVRGSTAPPRNLRTGG